MSGRSTCADDLGEDVPARDRVVGELAPGSRERLRVAEHLDQEVAIVDVLEIERLARKVGDAGPVGEHVADR